MSFVARNTLFIQVGTMQNGRDGPSHTQSGATRLLTSIPGFPFLPGDWEATPSTAVRGHNPFDHPFEDVTHRLPLTAASEPWQAEYSHVILSILYTRTLDRKMRLRFSSFSSGS